MKYLLQLSLILVVASFGLFSTAGAQWRPTNGPCGGTVTAVALSGSTVFAGTQFGDIFRSTDNGAAWSFADAGLITHDLAGNTIKNISVSGSRISVSTNFPSAFVSTDNGAQWTRSNSNFVPASIAVIGTNWYAASGAVYSSSDSGATWTQMINSMSSNYSNTSIAALGSSLFVGCNGGIFCSTDNGDNWTEANNGLADYSAKNIRFLFSSGSTLIAYSDYLYTSGDNGGSWTKVTKPSASIKFLTVINDVLFAGTDQGVYRSTNCGTDWTAINSGMSNLSVNALAVRDSYMYAGTDSGMYRSTDNGAHWTAANSGLLNLDLNPLLVFGSNMLIGTYGDFLSADGGTSWTANSAFAGKLVRCAATSGQNCFIGTTSGLYLSTNNGAVWTAANTGLTNTSLKTIAVNGTDLFAGTSGGGVFRSTNNGAGWIAVNNGIAYQNIVKILVSGSDLVAATSSGSGYVFYRSTDNGANWVMKGSGLSYMNNCKFSLAGNTLAAGTSGGVYVSSDDGANWTRQSNGLPVSNESVNDLAVSGSDIFIANSHGIYMSTNDGANWIAVNSGLIPRMVNCLAVSGENLYAGVYRSSVWHRPLSDMFTAIGSEGEYRGAREFALLQNYPNPFNPATDIRYRISDFGFVTLKAFNVLGEEVATLVNEVKAPGEYRAQWNAAGMPSGLYFYRLSTRGFSQIKSMLLIK